MAQNHLIAPFPGNINRDYFASWLSGLTDGEGCFYLTWVEQSKCVRGKHGYPRHRFAISLRDDDTPALSLIQSFWQCGSLSWTDYQPINRPNSKPKMYYYVDALPELIGVVIPHFDKHPLIAKKARDFAIWREAVLFVNNLPHSNNGRRFNQWSENDRQHFKELAKGLAFQRRHENATVAFHKPKPPVRVKPTALFPDLLD